MSMLHLKDHPTLADFHAYIADMVVERGFEREDLAKKFMLLLEETGEFAKSARKAAGIQYAEDSTQSEAAHEAADVFMVLLDICNILGVDLEQAFREKEAKNKTRTWN